MDYAGAVAWAGALNAGQRAIFEAMLVEQLLLHIRDFDIIADEQEGPAAAAMAEAAEDFNRASLELQEARRLFVAATAEELGVRRSLDLQWRLSEATAAELDRERDAYARLGDRAEMAHRMATSGDSLDLLRLETRGYEDSFRRALQAEEEATAALRAEAGELAAEASAAASRVGQLRCGICLEAPQEVALIPCGHCFCGRCVGTLRDCPSCRGEVLVRQLLAP